MSRPIWFVTLLKKSFSWRFFGARLTRIPILGPLMEKVLYSKKKNGDALYYLVQDHIVINQVLPEVENILVPSDIVRYFINQSSHYFIMDECLCRSANKCQTYPHDYGCLFLGAGTLSINPRLGRMVSKEEALAHIARCQELGLVHMIGRDKVDAVFMGVKPSTRLMTICNCCECCCLYKFLPQLNPTLQSKLTRMPGIHFEVSNDCIGCGKCSEGICFIDVIHIENGRAIISDDCRGCGRCTTVCPQDAIQLVIEDDNFIQQAILHLEERVDLS